LAFFVLKLILPALTKERSMMLMKPTQQSTPFPDPNTGAPLLHALRPKRIVVFRALQLGDMLCVVPALRALRQALPRAQVILAGLPWAENFTRRFRHLVDEFLAFPGHPDLPEQPADLQELQRFLTAVRARRYDLALQLHGDGRVSNGIVACFEASCMAGFRPAGISAWNIKNFLPYPDHGRESLRLLRLTTHLGAPSEGDHLEFPLDASDAAELNQFGLSRLPADRGYVCLHCGARSQARRWPLTAFASVADALHREYGLTIVLTGSGSERPIAQRLAARIGAPVTNAACDVSIGGLAALLRGSRLLISNDTGVSHIASALKLPSIILFRASDMQRWAPGDRRLHRCIWDPEGLQTDTVLAQARALLAARAEIVR
jgi:ADP-heptose:LPS heptosyltransferase